MKTKCLLVDDEPLAIEVIETYLSMLDNIEIVGKCTNAIQANDILCRKQVDLMFLDIKMPQLDGISFLKTLQRPPKVILTTAYRDYALTGYELDIIDYLLKPISLERFMKSINKYYSLKNESPIELLHQVGKSTTQEPFIYVRADKKTLKIYLKDIFFIQSLEDYVLIQKRDSKIITKDTIGHLEETLPTDMFIRIHRSYIVSVPKIEAITPDSIEIYKKALPIGRSYKKSVAKHLNYSERERKR